MATTTETTIAPAQIESVGIKPITSRNLKNTYAAHNGHGGRHRPHKTHPVIRGGVSYNPDPPIDQGFTPNTAGDKVIESSKPSQFGQYSVEYRPLVRSDEIPWVTDEDVPTPKKLTDVIAWTDAFVTRAGELALKQEKAQKERDDFFETLGFWLKEFFKYEDEQISSELNERIYAVEYQIAHELRKLRVIKQVVDDTYDYPEEAGIDNSHDDPVD